MSGRVKQGLSGGGLCYGYASVPGSKGERIIVESEAAVVQRIFEKYVEGRTPRKIAHDLNRDGVKPPRGDRWNASTINGNTRRDHGILRNDIYARRLAGVGCGS